MIDIVIVRFSLVCRNFCGQVRCPEYAVALVEGIVPTTLPIAPITSPRVTSVNRRADQALVALHKSSSLDCS
ncbi:hypothetical protein BaRGS_00011937, partial [Batillaria attramentaria]